MRGRLCMAMVAGALVVSVSACGKAAGQAPAAGPAQAGQVQPADPTPRQSTDPVPGSGSGPGAGTKATSPPHATSSAAAATATSAGGTTGSAAEDPQTCRATELAATFAYGPAVADGRRSGFVVLHNASNRDCDVAGFPVLQLRAADGAALPTVTTRLSDTSAAVTLAPGRSALADLEWNAEGGSCAPPAAGLEVQVNGDAAALTTTFTATVCDQGRITVAPFHL